MGYKIYQTLEGGMASKHLINSNNIHGGYCVVADTTERNALPVATANKDGIIVVGSLVCCQSDGKLYKCSAISNEGVASWVEFVPDLSNYVEKSQTAGLLKNDGTVDTNSYLTSHQDISGKVDKVTGKGLSENDYTTSEKDKLAAIAAGAQVNVIEAITVNGTAAEITNKTVALTIGESNVEVDGANSRILISDGADSYFVNVTKLTKPATPTIAAAQQSKSAVTGSVEITIGNIESGATAYYKIGDADYAQAANGKFSIATGFTNEADNAVLTKSVKVKAIKNGVESDESSAYTITITPKVAKPTLTTSNTDQYAASATVTITKSATTGATTEYSEDGGSTWTTLADNSTTITVSENKSAGAYQVRATKTDYETSETAQSSAITLNKKMAYYGFSTLSALTTEAQIKALIGGGSEKVQKLSGQKTITPTGNDNGYIWLCCVETLPYAQIVANQGDVIPFGFNDAITVAGWKCYRNTNAVPATSSHNVYIPNN